MQRVKVGRSARITLPEEAWQKLGVTEGEYLEAEVVETGVLLKAAPQERDREVDSAVAEGLADVHAGRVTPAFDTVEELDAYRNSEAYQRLLRDQE